MERSKEELMEELMAKLKEDLMKGRKQVAAREDIVVNVVKEEVKGIVHNFFIFGQNSYFG